MNTDENELPDGALHMAWLREGHEIGLITQIYTPDPSKHTHIHGRLQSELSYTFERWRWPERTRISQCPITMRTGWPTALLPTPDPHLIFFEWYDQGEAGYEGIALDTPAGDHQLAAESYEIGMPFFSQDLPVIFRSDVRYLVRCHAAFIAQPWQVDWEGTLTVAYVSVIDRIAGLICDIPVSLSLPVGWQLPEAVITEVMQAQQQNRVPPSWVRACSFSDDDHLDLHLIDDTHQIIALANPLFIAPPPSSPIVATSAEGAQEAKWQDIAAHHLQQRLSVKHLRHPTDAATIVAAERRHYGDAPHEWIVDDYGAIVWDAADVQALVWLRHGDEVGVLRGAPFDARKPGTPHMFFERRAWPDLTLLSQLALANWAGQLMALSVSPTEDAVVVQWEQQDNTAAFYRIALDQISDGVMRVDRAPAGVFDQISAQRPDGRFLVALRNQGIGWPTHSSMFRLPRRFLAGIATLYDWEKHTMHELPLCADFPANWQPPDLAQRRSPRLPRFYQSAISLVESVTFADERTLVVCYANEARGNIIFID